MVMAIELCNPVDQDNFQYSSVLYHHPAEPKSCELESRPLWSCSKTVFKWKAFLHEPAVPLGSNEVLETLESTVESTRHTSSSNSRVNSTSTTNVSSSTSRLSSFLQCFTRKDGKGLTTTGLAFLFALNRLPLLSKSKQELLQNLLIQLFHRLLDGDVTDGRLNSNRAFFSMTSSPTSMQLKPARVAPQIPKQARPLPPPPVPEHATDGPLHIPMTSSPPVPVRTKSLMCGCFETGDGPHLSDSCIFICTSEEDISEEELSLSNRAIDSAIRHVVGQRLFNSELSPVERAVGFSRNNSDAIVPHTHSAPSSSATTIVTTPDSGCGTAEDDTAPVIPENREPSVFIPRLDLQGALEEEEEGVFDVSDMVPPLDLSEIAPNDDVVRPKNPLQIPPTIVPSKSWRKRNSKSSPTQDKSFPNASSPIAIPPLQIPDAQDSDDSLSESLPLDGNLRWRDAWSTNEEIVPMFSAMERVVRRDVRRPVEEEELEVPPSSPENHVARLHSPYHAHHHNHHHHHHHHHKRHHHHHEGHLSRPKMNNTLRHETMTYDHIYASLEELLTSLNMNRMECGRPEDLTLMTRDQIRMEKIAMQRELLKHENRHGRPNSKEEKEIMRGVYERYRMVKRLLVDTMSPPFHSALRRFEKLDLDVNPLHNADDIAITFALAPSDGWKKNAEFKIEANDHISANLSLNELRKQQKEAKAKRKKLRRKIQEFEKEIEQQYGRKISPIDRLLIDAEYNEYKGLKLKLRLLSALIEKHSSHMQ